MSLLFLAAPIILLVSIILWILGHILTPVPVKRVTPLVTHDEYLAYLRTDGWQLLRTYRFILDGACCRRCKVILDIDSAQIHHLTYDRLMDEDIDDLVTLCERCHCEVHNLNPKLPNPGQNT